MIAVLYSLALQQDFASPIFTRVFQRILQLDPVDDIKSQVPDHFYESFLHAIKLICSEVLEDDCHGEAVDN